MMHQNDEIYCLGCSSPSSPITRDLKLLPQLKSRQSRQHTVQFTTITNILEIDDKDIITIIKKHALTNISTLGKMLCMKRNLNTPKSKFLKAKNKSSDQFNKAAQDN